MAQIVETNLASVVEFIGKALNQMPNIARYLKLKNPVVYYYESANPFTNKDIQSGAVRKDITRQALSLSNFVGNLELPQNSQYAIIFGDKETVTLYNLDIDYGKPVYIRETDKEGNTVYYTFRLGNEGSNLEVEVLQANRINFVYVGVHAYYHIVEGNKQAQLQLLEGIVDNYDGGGLQIAETRRSKESKVGFGFEYSKVYYPRTKAEVRDLLEKYFKAGDEYFVSTDAELLIMGKSDRLHKGFTRIVYNRRYN